MADYELVSVRSASQLHENLEKLLKKRSHIESIVVDRITDTIRVDLSTMANTFGHPDFRMKLKLGKSSEAEVIIRRLKTQDAPSRSQSEDLFSLLDVG